MPHLFGSTLSRWKRAAVASGIGCGLLGIVLASGVRPLTAEDKPAAKANEPKSVKVEVEVGDSKPLKFEFKIPSGLPDILHPEDNPATSDKIELGRQLYFDPRLSGDNTVSCASCHDPEKGWSNGDAFATGVGGKKGGRSAPTVLNTVYQSFQFWDGRAATLEEQALGPIQNPIEMNMPLPDVVKKLNGIKGYKAQFQKVFGTDVTKEGIARAIAAFERTVVSGDAPYDRFTSGDPKALSPAAEKGRALFFGAARCSSCHSGPNFTDNAFHNIGIGMEHDKPDVGRFEHSKLEGDTGSFKTPTLREIARTAPYMHDGRFKTLDEVVNYYNKGGHPNPYLDEEIFPLNLSKEQQADLVTFLKEGLSSKSYPLIKAPKLPE